MKIKFYSPQKLDWAKLSQWKSWIESPRLNMSKMKTNYVSIMPIITAKVAIIKDKEEPWIEEK
jgi:hypothetical protein